MAEQRNRTAALTDVNVHILRYVRDASDGQQEWEFFCECGDASCQEHVFLTLDSYVELHDAGRAVLAEGHHLSQVERARRLRADAEALRAQAAFQASRAKKNLDAS